MIIAFIVIGILMLVDGAIIGACIRLEKDDTTRALEDEEQMKYISEWYEKKRRKEFK